jgi:hypothetical protein
MLNGMCRPICASSADCLDTEVCDPASLVCVPGSADASTPPDAADSGVEDANGRDSGRKRDSGFMDDTGVLDAIDMSDAISSGDAIAIEAGALDMGFPDQGLVDTGTALDAGSAGDSGPPCSWLNDPATCTNSGRCTVATCPACDGLMTFAGCTDPGDMAPSCDPNPICVHPCNQITTQDACSVNTVCHPVFWDNQPCSCPTQDCCMHFAFCAPNAKAQCIPPPLLCAQPPPVCDTGFEVSYSGTCYEGCVKTVECN